MQSRQLFFIVIIFLNITGIQIINAQKTFLPGRITDQEGNITKGYIEYKNWNKSPNTIKFKKELKGISIKYTVFQLKSFRVAGELYESAEIKYEPNSRSTGNLKKETNLYFQKTNTFLLALIEGEKSLYYYKDENLIEHFYIKQNNNFDLLIFKRYLKLENDLVVKAENKKYKNQLAYYLSDHPDIQFKLKNLKYEKKNLIKLFKDYYSVTNKELKNHKINKPKSNHQFGAVLGLSYTIIKNKVDFQTVTKTSNSINPTIGLFYEVTLPNTNNKWSFYNDLLFSAYNEEGFISKTKYTYLKLNNMIRYTHALENNHLFFNAGFSNGIAISETEPLIDNSPNNLFPKKRYGQGILLGLGIKFKKIVGELRYERGNGMNRENFGYTTSSSTINLLMGFKF